ncbi:DNA helicase MCM9 [Vairimorpha necatrix]|uniref:DNA helicase n=1 Tax=Vairimorpha necatrix TaxID=6039 RepID=A0AAX4JAZ5_9MICR
MNTQPLFENDCISLIELCETNPELANHLIKNTSEYPFIYNKNFKDIPYIIFTNSNMKSNNVNKFVGVKGTIIKVGPVLLRNTKIEYTCLKCNFKGFMTDNGDNKSLSILCDSCGSTSVMKKECLNEAVKTQTVRVQNIGSTSSLADLYEIILEGEFAGKYQAGTEVVVCGVLCLKWKPLKINENIIVSFYIQCIYISKVEYLEENINVDDEEFVDFYSKTTFERRKFLIESLTDDIFGYSNVKLGLLLVLGNQYKENKSRSDTRQLSHMLLIGDAGTAKSHFLKVCSKLVSPTIMTNGTGTSNAGLTSCAVKQGKDWTLEAGALLLADLGICCIDEFNKLKVNEKGGLLEAMEQQTLSIAKAGMINMLNARCSIIAACNTKYQFDKNKSVSENTLISTPLVSRFDLIFGLFDIKDKNKDQKIADKILERLNFNLIDEKIKNIESWNRIKLKKFINLIRKKKITIDEKNSNILLKYYLRKKTAEGPNEFNTIRMLEGLVRLTETHAKLLGKNEVEEEDVFSVILLFETTVSSTSIISLKYDELFLNKDTFEEAIRYVKKAYSL